MTVYDIFPTTQGDWRLMAFGNLEKTFGSTLLRTETIKILKARTKERCESVVIRYGMPSGVRSAEDEEKILKWIDRNFDRYTEER